MNTKLFSFLNYTILLILIAVISCGGRVNTDLPKDKSAVRKADTNEYDRIRKTQGSTPSDNIRCGIQDKGGNLWFGSTGEGLYRYNGKTFRQYTVNDGLNSNFVWSVLEDKSGNIWIGTSEGINFFDGKNIKSIPISINADSSTAADTSAAELTASKTQHTYNEVFCIMQDKSGIIWFGTTAGVYCYNGKSFTRFLDAPGIQNSNGLSLKDVQCMLLDKSGNVWFGSGPIANEGITRYDGKALTGFKPKNEGWIRNIIETKDGKIWFGTRHYGACYYDGKDFTFFKDKAGIGNLMLQDKMGNLWFGGGEKLSSIQSDGGIWSYDGKAFRNFNEKDGLGNYSVWSITEDSAGNIWVGTRNNGLYRWDGKGFSAFF